MSRGAWGPFVPGIAAAERMARLRGLRVAVHLICGSRGRDVETALRRAEQDEGALGQAEAVFDQMAALDRRRVLSSFGACL